MPLPELRSALLSGGVASYMAQKLEIHLDLDQTLKHLSPAAQDFVALVAGSEQKVVDIAALYATEWHDDRRIQVAYCQLSPNQRVEVLVYFTLPLHEHLHHIDMLQTPFGVAFHSAAAREYVHFQQFAELLVEGGPDAIPPGRIIDFRKWLVARDIKISDRARSIFDMLADDLRLMETWGDFDRVKSALTVTETDNVFEALGKRFIGVRVNDAWSTVTVEGISDWYLRPSTILEGRAVVLSILWASRQLQGLESEGQDLAHFVRSVYAPDGDFDYRFLPDLAAWWTGHDRIEDLLIRQVRPAARTLLSTLYMFAWVALHAPPVENLPEQYRRYYPPERFMSGLMYALVKNTAAGTITLDDILAFDSSDIARNDKLPGVEETLAIALEAIDDLRATAGAVLNPEMRDHFNRSATMLESTLTKRKGSGYMWPPGMGPTPMRALQVRSPELLEPYRPGRTVHLWFDFRRRSFFRPSSARKLWPTVSELFYGRPLTFRCVSCSTTLAVQVSKYLPHYRINCSCGCVYNVPPIIFAAGLGSQADLSDLINDYSFRPLEFPCSCGHPLKGIIFDVCDGFALMCLNCGLDYNFDSLLLQRLRDGEQIAISELYAKATASSLLRPKPATTR